MKILADFQICISVRIEKKFVDLLIFNFQAVSVVDVKKIIMEMKTDKS